MNIRLGNRVRDVVTGYQGIAVSRIEFLNGCIQFAVVPKVGADGKAPDGQYFDHQRLEFVDDGIVPRATPTGGPQRDAPPTPH